MGGCVEEEKGKGEESGRLLILTQHFGPDEGNVNVLEIESLSIPAGRHVAIRKL